MPTNTGNTKRGIVSAVIFLLFILATFTPLHGNYVSTSPGGPKSHSQSVNPNGAYGGGGGGATPTVFSTNTGVANCCVLSWPATTTGNVAPTTDITGANTGFSTALNGVCVDPTGTDLWTVDKTNNKLSRFNLTDTGNVSPTRTVSGASTTLNAPLDCHFDSTGNMWVANQGGGNLLEFSKANLATGGNVAPSLTLSGHSQGLPQSITLDSSDNLWYGDFSAGNGSGACVGAPISLAGWSTPITNILAPWQHCWFAIDHVEGVAVDSSGKIYAADNSRSSILVWNSPQAITAAAPDAELTGASTGLSAASHLAATSTGIWTANNGAIRFWTLAHVTGNTAPDQSITGAATNISGPFGIAVH